MKIQQSYYQGLELNFVTSVIPKLQVIQGCLFYNSHIHLVFLDFFLDLDI